MWKYVYEMKKVQFGYTYMYSQTERFSEYILEISMPNTVPSPNFARLHSWSITS
jgi:hypothetical protein